MKDIEHFITSKLDNKYKPACCLRGKKILITVTDITRTCPDKLILNILLNYLIKKGALKKNIHIIIANGLHREMTKKEIIKKYGDKACKFNIKNHDALNNLAAFGIIDGLKIYLNKKIKDADIIFSIGLIEPHHYAGFSGGAKSVAIGIASESLINYTHSYKFITNKNVSIGNIKNNPFQNFLWNVLAKTKKDFNFINVVMRDEKIIDSVAGSSFSQYLDFIIKKQKHFIKKCRQKYDSAILNISKGKSANFYQASRAFTYVALTHGGILKDGGFVVLNSSMEEGFGFGLGEKRFAEILKKSKNLNDLVKNVKNSRCGGAQRAILFSQALKRNKLIITGAKSDLSVLRKFGVEIIDTKKKAMNYIVGTGRDLSLRDKKNIKIITINDPFSKLYVGLAI